MKSWKTTVGGSISGLGFALIAANELDWLKPEHKYWFKLVGFSLGILGPFLTGLFARDNDKSSEQVGITK